MSETRGQRARPRVAVIGDWSAAERAHITRVFPSVTVHMDIPGLKQAWAPQDLDLLVLGESVPGHVVPRGNATRLRPFQDIHVIIFGCPEIDDVPFHRDSQLCLGNPSGSSEYALPTRSGPLRRVLDRSMREVADVRGCKTLRVTPLPPAPGGFRPNQGDISARLLDASLARAKVPDAPLAVSAIREGCSKGIAWLPNIKEDRLDWIEALVHEWAEHDRASFASVIPWREQPAWMNADEVALSQQLADIACRRALALAAFRQEEDDAERALAVARTTADREERVLLTGQGPDLVRVVTVALTCLGFTVEDMDSEMGPGVPLLEDLRLRLPGRPQWEALVEIKGHLKRGLKLEDLGQARRPRERYFEEKKRWPDMVMLVHNGQASLPPEQRPRPFETSPGELRALEQEGYWLVVPTPDLFRLLRDAETLGSAGADLLADARGLFAYPSQHEPGDPKTRGGSILPTAPQGEQ